MNTAGVLILGTFVAVMATACSGPEQTLASSTEQQIGASSSSVVREASGSPLLFEIGGLPVHVWAPVQPGYNTEANRNLAADPLWGPNWSASTESVGG
jgi:hypothetical protein